jgi:hypothetical protein
MSLDLFQWGKDWLDENIVFLMPELPTVDQLLDRCRAAKVQRGAKLFILDNWMSMQHPTKGDKLDNIDKELTQIGNFAARENVLMVVVTHGTKPNGTQKMSDDLGVYGSAHSAAFGNKADVVLEVARYWPVDYVSAIKVSKVRSRYEGREGEIYLQFDKTTGRYLNIGPDSDLMGQIRESKRKGGRGNKSSGLLQEPTPAQKAAEPEPAPVENVVQLGLQR